MTALETYDRFAGTTVLGWSTLAADLRAEAEQCIGGQRTKRLDRALDCEARALAQRTAARPFGPCDRDADGNCVGRCGRRGHLGRPLTVAEWLSFFGPDVPGSAASVGR